LTRAAAGRAELWSRSPQRQYEDTLAVLGGFYRRPLSKAALGFLTGLAGWDRLDGTRRDRFAAAVTDAVPRRRSLHLPYGERRLSRAATGADQLHVIGALRTWPEAVVNLPPL
jgi:NACHT N-terminal Helical domain 7